MTVKERQHNAVETMSDEEARGALRLRSNVILFEDPPGVAGSGWPSGGPDPANGLVEYTGSPENGVVYRSTCTLPGRPDGRHHRHRRHPP